MARSGAAGASSALDAPTLAAALRQTAAAAPERVAYRTRDGAIEITWGAALARVDALAGGLAAHGVGHGDAVALMIGNRPEFHLCDLAAMTLGAVPFSIYLTSAPEQVAQIAADAGARIAIAEPAYVDVLRAARVPGLETIVVIDEPAGAGGAATVDAGEGGATAAGAGDGSAQPATGDGADGVPGLLSLAELEASGASFDGAAAAARIVPDDLLTLIYTSGTTGPPKGVELTHRNLMAGVRAVDDMIDFPPGSKVISWLPSAHIAERAAHHYVPLVFGMTVTCCEDARQIAACLPQVHPTWFFAVPRVWEKLKAGLEAMLAAQPAEQAEPVRAALDAALRKVRLEQTGAGVPDELAAAVAEADATLFAPLRAHLGLDELRAVNVGAAPTPVEVIEFFHAIGVELAELWGMSETCGAGAVNPPGRVKIGTVGPPPPGIELRIADDGEVLLRGPIVMRGYRNLPEQTAEAVDADGWLHTGDVGSLDADGYLTIVDRKKELIINAAGKNMSPANIESTIKGASPLIGQVCCIGDGRRYNTALIVLDPDVAAVWAAQHGLGAVAFEALADQDAVRAAVQEGIDAANAKLARVEQIKRFTILRGDWQPGGDELTPTMKLKRRPIAEKHAAAIEAMYV